MFAVCKSSRQNIVPTAAYMQLLGRTAFTCNLEQLPGSFAPSKVRCSCSPNACICNANFPASYAM